MIQHVDDQVLTPVVFEEGFHVDNYVFCNYMM